MVPISFVPVSVTASAYDTLVQAVQAGNQSHSQEIINQLGLNVSANQMPSSSHVITSSLAHVSLGLESSLAYSRPRIKSEGKTFLSLVSRFLIHLFVSLLSNNV